MVSHSSILTGETTGLVHESFSTPISLNNNGVDIDNDGEWDAWFNVSQFGGGLSVIGGNKLDLRVSDSTSVLVQTIFDTTLSYWITLETYPGSGNYFVQHHQTTDLVLPAEADSFELRPTTYLRPAYLPIGFSSNSVSGFEFGEPGIGVEMRKYVSSSYGGSSPQDIVVEKDFPLQLIGQMTNFILVKKTNSCGTIWAWIQIADENGETAIYQYAHSIAEM